MTAHTMSYLKLLSFWSQDGETTSDYLWLSTNVGFVFSCLIEKRKVRTNGLQKINVILGEREEAWSGEIDYGVADIEVASKAPVLLNDPRLFEDALSSAAFSALEKVAQRGIMNGEVIRELRGDVETSGYRYQYLLAKLNAPKARRPLRIWLLSSFSSLTLRLETPDGSFHLLNFWPSPWLALLSFKDAKLLPSNAVALKFSVVSADMDRIRFGTKAIDESQSELPVEIFVDISPETGRGTATYTFRIDKLSL